MQTMQQSQNGNGRRQLSNNNFQAHTGQLGSGFTPNNSAINTSSSAFIATPNTVLDPSWYRDSGASNHITSDAQNISQRSDYTGNDKLIVGNGAKLNISHVGSSIISSHTIPQTPLFLNNILHVPSITKNLLSISQFTKDNDVLIILYRL